MGEALLYSIRQCTGDACTKEAYMGWVKIFSRMFRTILPVVIRFELHSKELSQQITTKRFQKEGASELFTKHTTNGVSQYSSMNPSVYGSRDASFAVPAAAHPK
jgi:hypothetical protein